MRISLEPQPWQQHPLAYLVAVVLGCGPTYALAIGTALLATEPVESMVAPDLLSSFLNLLTIVALGGGLVLVCLYFINGETPDKLQLAPGTFGRDIWMGLLLTGRILVVLIALGVISMAFSQVELPEANRQIALTISSDPLLLAFWLGPVAWLQAALFEELMRAFMLSRIWRIWQSPLGKELGLLGSALLFGAAHAYEGIWGIAATAVIGLMLGEHYMRHGRLLPLIVAHGIYDTLALLLLVSSVRTGAI